jgi:hypothetical protein
MAGRSRLSGNESVADMQGATRRVRYILDTVVAQIDHLDAAGVSAAFLTLLEDTAEVEAAGWVEAWNPAPGLTAVAAVDHLVGLLRRRFQPAGGGHVVASNLLRLRQTGPLQDFDKFVIEWFRLYNRAHGTLYASVEGEDIIMTTLFLQSLADQAMAQAVLVDPAPKTPQMALEAIRSRRVFAKSRPAAATPPPASGTFAAVAARPPFDSSGLRKADGIPEALIQARMADRSCLWCGEAGHQRRNCERRKAGTAPVIPESFRSAAPK